VVWGLGGAGKTQLVLDYVQQHRTKYKATFWIEAGRKESLERDFVHLYQTLFGLYVSVGAETVRVEDAVTGVKSWFAGQRGLLLMVFDGADTIEEQGASGYINIKHFIPDAAALDVIVTSRSGTAKDMTRLGGVQVGEMEAGQAAELFQKYARIHHNAGSTKDEILCIVRELGCLALAVTLAATYVGSTPRLQSNIKAYLPEYRQRRRELLRRKPESLVHQYSESVLTTWETSYAAVARQCAEASVLMTMLSFLSFDDIYVELFCADTRVDSPEQTEDDSNVSWRRLVSPQRAVDVYKIEECFAVLQKYSLVQWKADQQSYAMHKLVHAWGYDRLGVEEQGKYSRAVFRLVVEAVKAVGAVGGYSRAPKDKLRLVPHVIGSFEALTSVGNKSNKVTKDTVDEMEDVGEFVTDLGRWPEARAVKAYVLQTRNGLLGKEHPDTITAMKNLAVTLADQGQLEEAAAMQKKVLAKRKQILGKDHPSTISAMNNLAATLGEQGQLEEAAAMRKEVLEKRKQMLGNEHPDTISAMSNLAVTLVDQGQLEEAAAVRKGVLEKRKQILGKDHPSTISAMNNLAITLAGQGQLEEAAAMRKEVLEKRKQILGEEHPDTISAMSNLANTLADQGQLEAAAAMRKEVLEKQKQILGERHPHTIIAMSNLATTLQKQGQLDEAAAVRIEVLEKRKQILGEKHPHTITAMSNLAVTLQEQGQLEEAAAMKREVLEKRKQILGEEHPHTISAMNNLANTLAGQGQLEEAAAMQKEVLEKWKQILGEEHPYTIRAMNNLTNTLREQGQLEEAAAVQKEVLEKQKQIFGKEHPYTIRAMNNLAVTLADQGQLEEAAAMQKEVLEMRKRILGKEHPDTTSAINNLAITLRLQAQPHEKHTDPRVAASNLAVPMQSQVISLTSPQLSGRKKSRVFAFLKSKLQK
jgi:tetratricopeptide (TPR) repeat protein